MVDIARSRHLLLYGFVVVAAALVQPRLVMSTLRSPRALAVIALVALLVVVVGKLFFRWWGKVPAAVARAVVVGLASWLLIVPAVRQRTLVEDLPTHIAGAAASPRVAAPDAPGASSEPAIPPHRGDLPAPTPEVSPTPQFQAPSEGHAEPKRVTTGALSGIGHHATGEVAVYQLADGSHVVRFEDVDIRNAPDPVLYLVPGRDRRGRDGGIEVAPLKATRGTFHHVIPPSFDLARDFTVFVWCEQYTTPIAAADQQPV